MTTSMCGFGALAMTWEDALGIDDGNTFDKYRRKYVGLYNTDTSISGDRFAADHIAIVGDREAGFGTFDEGTRISIARRGLIEAINRNTGVVRFGLLRMRQSSPALRNASLSGRGRLADQRRSRDDRQQSRAEAHRRHQRQPVEDYPADRQYGQRHDRRARGAACPRRCGDCERVQCSIF